MKNKFYFFALFLLLPARSAYAQVIVTAVGTGTAGYNGDYIPATAAELYEPYGVAVDDSGNLYICDEGNRRIRKVSPGYGGTITTIAGDGTIGYSGDGGLGIYAQISGAIDVVVDHRGNVYIADGGVGNSVIRKITPADTISTIAGTGVAGYNGDGIPATAAQLNIPYGVAVDSVGNIYIVDGLNYRIRMVDTAGIIHTIAGIGVPGFSPDGSLADTAQLDSLYSIRIDKAGNIFFGNGGRIRKIDTAGIISTIVGNGTFGFTGDGGMATAAEIGGGAIALDSAGNLFIADGDNYRIREVSATDGIINTVAGDSINGFSGDGGNPLVAELCFPAGVVVNDSGEIYIGDLCNDRIRLVTKHPLAVSNVSGIVQGINVYPNPSKGLFSCLISSGTNEQTTVIVTNILGEKIKEFSVTANQQIEVQLSLPSGMYFLSAITAQQQFNQKIIIQ